MLYKENWRETLKYLEAFWNKDYIDRCSLAIPIVNDTAKTNEIIKMFTPKERSSNPEVFDKIARSMCENRSYLAESLPCRSIDFGTAGHCELFGCKPIYAESTIWFEHIINEPNSSLVHTDLNNCEGFERQKNFMSELVKLSGGDYLLPMPDNCGSVDALACLRGTENLLCDMYDDPDFVSDSMRKIVDAWKISQKAYHEILKGSNMGGSTHSWMHTWSKDFHVQLQCDFSVMISPDMFEEFVLPELDECAKAVDHCSYHLDGVEEVRHLEMILSINEIDNIQWTPVAGQPKTSEHIEVFKRIQKAGKGLILSPEPDEIEILLKELSHKGLRLNINKVQDEESAKDIINLAKKHAHA